MNRVVLKVLWTSLAFSLTASITLALYMWRAPPVAVRRHTVHAADRRNAAPFISGSLLVPIISTAVDIPTSSYDHKTTTRTDVPRRREISISEARLLLQLQAITTPPQIPLDTGSAYPAIVGNPPKAGLRPAAAEAAPAQGDLASTSTNKVTLKHVCAPVPFSSNLAVLGRALERCLPVSTRLMTSSSFTQDDVYITIKTTQSNHGTRLLPLLLTWLQTVQPEQVHIVTDKVSTAEEFYKVANELGFHVTESNCKQSHLRDALCCKTGVQYLEYFSTVAAAQREGRKPYKWFCHFDDDMYVNIPMLVKALTESTNHSRDTDFYFGRWPVEMVQLKNGHPVNEKKLARIGINRPRMMVKWATGAAYCLSSSLLYKMETYFRELTYQDYCSKLALNDDLVVAVLAALEGTSLHSDERIRTHYDNLSTIPTSELQNQITISYSVSDNNTISSSGLRFSSKDDPTRFLSYHCLLYPSTSWCKR